MSAELEQAYVKHKQSLLAIALNVTGCQGLAEDAIQIAIEKLIRLKGSVEDLDSYLFRSVRNAAIDLVRKRSRESRKMESFFADNDGIKQAADSPFQQSVHAEQDVELRQSIEQLPESEKEIILLKVYSGFTFEQIASITQSNSNTVSTRYRRTLEKLRRQLKVNYE